MRAVGDAVYATVVWTPILSFMTACSLVVLTGLMQLEAHAQATHYFIK